MEQTILCASLVSTCWLYSKDKGCITTLTTSYCYSKPYFLLYLLHNRTQNEFRDGRPPLEKPRTSHKGKCTQSVWVHKALSNIVSAGSEVFINLATSIGIVTDCNKLANNHMLWTIESQLVFNTGCIVSTHTHTHTHTLHNLKFKCSYDKKRSKQIVITRNTIQRGKLSIPYRSLVPRPLPRFLSRSHSPQLRYKI